MITALERAVRWLTLTEAKRRSWQPAPPRPGIRAGGIRDRALRVLRTLPAGVCQR